MGEAIPFGQPILVGHHSEQRDRRYRARIDSHFSQAVALEKKAAFYENKANSLSDAISSDDPDALSKLEAKLEQLTTYQERMKVINKLYKKAGRACLDQLSETEKEEVISHLQHWGDRAAYPGYCLSNNNQNMRRIKARIATLKLAQSQSVREDIVGKDYQVTEDKDDNRILFLFDQKPEPEVRTQLKRHGFKWSPSRGAWVRMLNSNGRFAADSLVKLLNQRAE